MPLTSIPLRQHENIKKNATQLANIIRAGELEGNTRAAEKIVKKLLLEITSHLRIEDEKVYPALESHSDTHVRKIAWAFRNEMGQMAPKVVTWGERWSSSRISSEPEAFIDETRGIFQVLKDRIEREERELYPLLKNLV